MCGFVWIIEKSENGKDAERLRKKVCGFVWLISENGKKHINGSYGL